MTRRVLGAGPLTLVGCDGSPQPNMKATQVQPVVVGIDVTLAEEKPA